MHTTPEAAPDEAPVLLETQVVPPPLNPKASLAPNADVKSSASEAGDTPESSSTLTSDTPEPVKKMAPRPEAGSRPRRSSFSPAPEPAPAPVVTAPAPPPPVEVLPAPRADPFQALNDAIVACSHEDVPTRIRCEQAARMRYCKGNWGVAFQCPLGPNPDAQ